MCPARAGPSRQRNCRHAPVVGSLAGSADKLADNIERFVEAMITLAESGVQTNRRIDQLGMRVDQLVGAMGVMMQRQAPLPNVG
jgi:hypothetical protein